MDGELANAVREKLGALDAFMTTQTATLTKQTEQQAALEQRLRRFMESNAKLPGGEGEDGALHPSALGLKTNKALLGWLGSPQSRNSSLAFDIATRGGLITKNVITNPVFPEAVRGVSGPPSAPARLVELIPVAPITAGAVTFVSESSWTSGAAVVPETTLKPQSNLVVAVKTAATEVIASFLKLSTQTVADSPEVLNWAEQRLMAGVQLELENVMLNKPVSGLLALASSLDAAYTPTTPTGLDLIGSAVSQLLAKGYTPSGIVVSGSDANVLRLLKDSTGSYVWTSPDSGIGTTTIWSIPAVVSPFLAPGTALVGDFNASTRLFLREAVRVDIAYQNEDDFVKNLACLRAEMRAILAVLLASGLVKVTMPAGAGATAAAAGKKG